ncbi:hypothetical protein [Actinomadura sp. WAC 06369]|uniref:hypothetical protein n=1 Tax=Actinomadura sp. WAC 06369 TaxID=2203193 RepID=UPI000F76A528|nr:hypothetical protein [Actinomadura sp. WAC 06369]
MKYGYMVYTFAIHKFGSPTELLQLGNLGEQRDAVAVLFGALKGIEAHPRTEKRKHVRISAIEGLGRTVKFRMEPGRSGIDSKIYEAGSTEPVFTRTTDHIESNEFRGLIVAPRNSDRGLLVVEVQGHHSSKTLLTTAIKQVVKENLRLIVDFDAVVDERALQEYLEKAAVKAITLRRSGLPIDIAEAVAFPDASRSAGRLEMKITPDKSISGIVTNLVSRFKDDDAARNRLLTIGGHDFSELSIGFDSGHRQTTLTITSDKVPSFIYDLPGVARPDDETFYREVRESVVALARVLGIPVGASWDAGTWTPDALSTILPAPWRDEVDDPAPAS